MPYPAQYSTTFQVLIIIWFFLSMILIWKMAEHRGRNRWAWAILGSTFWGIPGIVGLLLIGRKETSLSHGAQTEHSDEPVAVDTRGAFSRFLATTGSLFVAMILGGLGLLAKNSSDLSRLAARSSDNTSSVTSRMSRPRSPVDELNVESTGEVNIPIEIAKNVADPTNLKDVAAFYEDHRQRQSDASFDDYLQFLLQKSNARLRLDSFDSQFTQLDNSKKRVTVIRATQDSDQLLQITGYFPAREYVTSISSTLPTIELASLSDSGGQPVSADLPVRLSLFTIEDVGLFVSVEHVEYLETLSCSSAAQVWLVIDGQKLPEPKITSQVSQIVEFINDSQATCTGYRKGEHGDWVEYSLDREGYEYPELESRMDNLAVDTREFDESWLDDWIRAQLTELRD